MMEIRKVLLLDPKGLPGKTLKSAARFFEKHFQSESVFLSVLQDRVGQVADLGTLRDKVAERVKPLLPRGTRIRVEFGKLRDELLVALKEEQIDLVIVEVEEDTGGLDPAVRKAIQAAQVPVLAVVQGRRFPPRRIGLPLQVHPREARALEWGKTLKDLIGSTVYALHFVEIPELGLIEAINPSEGVRKIQEEFEESGRQKVQEFLKQYQALDWIDRVIVAVDKPAPGILQAVPRYRLGLLVMTLPRVSFLEHLFFGTTTEAVLSRMPCHLLVLPTE